MSQFLRVCAVALALSSLSFAAGVAGDLSAPPPVSGATVIVRIPPPLPLDAPRAGPLPPLRTAAAEASVESMWPQPAVREPESDALATEIKLASDHELIHSTPDVPVAASAKAEQVHLG